MTTAQKRIVLRTAFIVVALTTAMTGLLASFVPRTFYDSYPVGLSWVSKLPPYNEHLITDVGGLYLAYTVLFIWVAITLRRSQIIPIVVTWTLVQAIHFVFHATNLENFDTGDAIAQTVSLALLLVLPAIALTLRVDQPREA